MRVDIAMESNMQSSKVALATAEDLDCIMQIYDRAKKYMIETGNPNQWNGTYPERELLEQDIAKQQLYVYKVDGQVHAVFAFIIGEDATYAYIEDGQWINDMPYGTIHRLASDGVWRGVLEKCVAYCAEQIDNLRADTHHDNKIMQHLLEKNGFERCGIIYLANGAPRIAYHFVVSAKYTNI